MQHQRTERLLQRLWHGADYNYEQWLDMPDILAEDFRLMRLAHCNTMSVGIFSWVMLEPDEGRYEFGWLDRLMDRLNENGLTAILATPSAGPPAWLAAKYPETRRMSAQHVREPYRGRQNFCYASPVYRQKITALNTQLAARYGKHPALLLWHVSNEYVSTPCHCDRCYGAFRDWLKARYGDLDALNHAWWTTFWSHRYTDWAQIEPVDPSIQALMLDWQRFNSAQALDFFLAECEPLRTLTPDIPITTNFMQPDVGLNYWDFAKHVDVISWDSYPRWHQTDDASTALQTAFYHDLHRSYKQGQPFLLMESTPSVTNWQGISRLKKPGAHKLTSLQAVAHGANSVQYFQWRQSRGGGEKFHGAVVSHLGQQNTRVFRDVQEVGAVLEQLHDLTESRVRAQVAIVYDFENEWALSHAQLSGSLYKNYQRTCLQHYRPFWTRGIAVDVISAGSDFSPYQLVIAPMLYMLNTNTAEQIEAFVQSGGTFVTTYLSGLVDDSDLCYIGGYPAALRRTLGIVSEEMDSLTDQQAGTLAFCDGNSLGLSGSYAFKHYAELVQVESAHALAAYTSEFYAGYPALLVNAHGEGQAYYVAARTDEGFLNDFYRALTDTLKLDAECPGNLPDGVSWQMRQGDNQQFVFVMNFSAEPQQITLDSGWQDVLTGTAPAAPITIPPYDLLVLVREKLVNQVP